MPLLISFDTFAAGSYKSLPTGHKCNCQTDQSILEKLKCFDLDLRNTFTGEVQQAERLRKNKSVKEKLNSGDFKDSLSLDNYLNAYRKAYDQTAGGYCFPRKSSLHQQDYMKKIKPAIAQATKAYGIPSAFLTCLGFKESKFDLKARNKRSLATGVYQVKPDTWNEFSEKRIRPHQKLKNAKVYERKKSYRQKQINSLKDCIQKGRSTSNFCKGQKQRGSTLRKDLFHAKSALDSLNRHRDLVVRYDKYRKGIKLRGVGPNYSFSQATQAKESVGMGAMIIYDYKTRLSKYLDDNKISYDSNGPEFLILVAATYNAGFNGVLKVLHSHKAKTKSISKLLGKVKKEIYAYKGPKAQKIKSKEVTAYTETIEQCMVKDRFEAPYYPENSKNSRSICLRQKKCYPEIFKKGPLCPKK